MEDPRTVAIRSHMAQRWPDNKLLTTHVMDVWADYQKLDVIDLDHTVEQLTNTFEAQFWQRLWEIQLGSHLFRLGYKTKSPAEGPDFRFDVDGLRVWVEAGSPEPKCIPDAWFAFPKTDVSTEYPSPDSEMLLRWTSMFRDKRCKFSDYAKKGIIGPRDACVIAINGGQLSGFWETPCGLSQMPWAVEIVFPVGSRFVQFSRETDEVWLGQAERHEVIKTKCETVESNPVTIELNPFVTLECSGISALVTCVDKCPPAGGLQLYVAHNPLATVPIPLGLFGDAAQEWEAVAIADGSGDYSLHRSR